MQKIQIAIGGSGERSIDVGSVIHSAGGDAILLLDRGQLRRKA